MQNKDLYNDNIHNILATGGCKEAENLQVELPTIDRRSQKEELSY